MGYDMTDFDSLNYSGCGCNHSSYSGCGCDSHSNFSVASPPELLKPTLIARPYKIEAVEGQFVPNNTKNTFPSSGKYPQVPTVLPTVEMGGYKEIPNRVDEVVVPVIGGSPSDKEMIAKNKGTVSGGTFEKNKMSNILAKTKAVGLKTSSVSIKRKHLKYAIIGIGAIIGYKLFKKVK